MKRISIAIVVALCLAVAKPAFANIVWATYGPTYCFDRPVFIDYVTYNETAALTAVELSGDDEAYYYINTHGWNAPAIIDYMDLQVQNGGCNY